MENAYSLEMGSVLILTSLLETRVFENVQPQQRHWQWLIYIKALFYGAGNVPATE